MVLEACPSHRSGGVEAVAGLVKSLAQRVLGLIPRISHIMNRLYRAVLAQLCFRRSYLRVPIDS